MNKRLETFTKRFPKLGQKIQHILMEAADPQEYPTLDELSSINIDSTLMKNLYNSSVESHVRLERSISKNKVSNAEPPKKKKLRVKT